jgi:iron complex transport system substrate-binding protein
VRIVSLCPSITESLVAMHLDDSLVGVTRYCIHPRAALAGVPRMGGTKNPDLSALRTARPDLVFCNGEENRSDDIEALKREFAVDVSHPRTVAEIPSLLRHFGRLTGREREAEEIASKVENGRKRVVGAARSSFRYVYLIWNDPWMTVGPRTYICDLLRTVGGSNCFEGEEGTGTDYPAVSEAEIVAAAPGLLILPDEPYRFLERDAAFWREKLPATTSVVLVPGDDFCWHGVRTLRGLEAASALVGRVAPARG